MSGHPRETPLMAAAAPIPALLLTGTIGSGKTALASELGELLSERGRPNAVIDLDWLGWLHAPAGRGVAYGDLIARNLELVWPNFRAAGARYLVLARAVQDGGELEQYKLALPDVELKVVRVEASEAAITARLTARDTGVILEGHLTESKEMARALEAANLEHFVIRNEDRPVREVAEELAAILGWG